MTSNVLQLEEVDDDSYYVAVGDIIAGKYRVERVLGSGGMAFVLSARHIELDETFALKFLDARFLGNAEITERFTQEAKAACKIRSEHVARVYDVGVHEGAPFFVMDHLQGRDLASVVNDSGPLRVDDAVEYVMQACEALAVAHCHGIVHRDIKPENLFLVEREGLPIIKVLDFGISKVALAGGEPPSRLTGELTLGTPCYMSPEQIRSTASADPRSDLWSLGVVLYELLAGTEAFRASSANAVCAAVLERQPQSLLELRPEVPQGLADVVMTCLEKDPANRFEDVAELAMALLPFAPTRALVSAERSSSVMRGARRPGARDQRVSEVRESAPASSRSHGPRGAAVSVANPVLVERPRHRGRIKVLVALVVFLGVAIGIRDWRSKRDVRASQAALSTTNDRLAPVFVASEPVTVPTAMRRAPAVDTRTTPDVAVAALPLPKRPPTPAAVLPPRVQATARASASAASAAPAPSAEGAGVKRSLVAATPSALGSIELGY